MSIKIEIFGEDAQHALRELRDFAVGLQGRPAVIGIAEAQNFAQESSVDVPVRGVESVKNDAGPTATRERGQPSPGKARRTKAEIAEDEAADAADDAAEPKPEDMTSDPVLSLGNILSTERAAISTGEERVGPEDDEATVEQDEADETAETEANREPGVVTRDDLRQALGRYQKKHGMPAAVEAVKAGGLIGSTIDQVAEAMLPAMIAKVDAATAGAAEATVETAKPATKQDLINVMLKYAAKFDGQTTDMTKMKITMEDCPKVFKMLFGDDVVAVSKVPVDGYAKAVAGIEEMLTKNPFGRQAVA